MSETNPATASTRVAIEFLTLWMEPDRWGAAEHIERALNDPYGPSAGSIIAGHCNLGMLLVLELAKARGATTADELKATAGEILRKLSRDLPE